MVLERKIWLVIARRMKDGPGGQGAPAPMRGSRAGFDVAFINSEVEVANCRKEEPQCILTIFATTKKRRSATKKKPRASYSGRGAYKQHGAIRWKHTDVARPRNDSYSNGGWNFHPGRSVV